MLRTSDTVQACTLPAREPRSSALRLAGAARSLAEPANSAPRWAESSSPQASVPVRWEYVCAHLRWEEIALSCN